MAQGCISLFTHITTDREQVLQSKTEGGRGSERERERERERGRARLERKTGSQRKANRARSERETHLYVCEDSCNWKMLGLLALALGSAVVLYVLFTRIIPAAVQTNSKLALVWNVYIVPGFLNLLTRTSQPQRMLKAVQEKARRGDPDGVIAAIDHFCRHKEWAMNVGDDKGLILDSVVTEINPSTVLELGTYCGYSTVRIARLLSPGSKFITLEFNPQNAVIARQIIAHAGLQDKVILVEGDSGDLIPTIKEKFGINSFDFVFLDHWKESYVPDTKRLEGCGLLKKGSVLLADNVICPGAPEYLKYVRNNPHYKTQYYPSNLEYTTVEDGLERSMFLGGE